jgi:hypothetical protein
MPVAEHKIDFHTNEAEFARIVSVLEKDFGITRQITRDTVEIGNLKKRIRVTVGQPTRTLWYFNISIDDLDFDYLAVSVPIREEVWFISVGEKVFSEGGSLTLEVPPQGFAEPEISNSQECFPLYPYLFFTPGKQTALQKEISERGRTLAAAVSREAAEKKKRLSAWSLAGSSPVDDDAIAAAATKVKMSDRTKVAAKEQDHKSLRRLKRHEFSRLVDITECCFGKTSPITQFTIKSEGSGDRTRVMVGRKTAAPGRYTFSAGKRDFDFLIIGIEDRDEVWLVSALAAKLPANALMSVVIDDPSAINPSAYLRAPGYSLSLRSSLLFPTRGMIKASEESRRQALRIDKNDAKKKLLQTELVAKRHSNAHEKVSVDADFVSVFKRATQVLGVLAPINLLDWRTSNRQTVHFSISKPYRGTTDRAFVSLTPSILSKDWLAVGVRGSEAAWLIPMTLVKQFSKSYGRRLARCEYTPFFGFKSDQDRMWFEAKKSSLEFLAIDAFKLYATTPSQIAAGKKRRLAKRRF